VALAMQSPSKTPRSMKKNKDAQCEKQEGMKKKSALGHSSTEACFCGVSNSFKKD